jgi:hypothetical protein
MKDTWVVLRRAEIPGLTMNRGAARHDPTIFECLSTLCRPP